MIKPFAVIGASNERFGNFVVNHWGKSLIKHVDKKVTDIILLDYGLNKLQKKNIHKMGIKLIKCKKDGHIVNLRYRDILYFLKKNRYNQIIACDAGDIIFQKNIMPLFTKDSKTFRVVIENLQPPLLAYSLAKSSFSNEDKKRILDKLRNKKMINGGLIVAPRKKFMELCNSMLKMIKRMDSFGPDQIVLNYFLYVNGFIDLGNEFNFIPVTAEKKFKIKRGVFYKSNGELISVVHNAGNMDFFRVIENFGYGQKYNHFKLFPYIVLKAFYKLGGLYRIIVKLFTN